MSISRIFSGSNNAGTADLDIRSINIRDDHQVSDIRCNTISVATGATIKYEIVESSDIGILTCATGLTTNSLLVTNEITQNILFSIATGTNKISVPVVNVSTGINFGATGNTLSYYQETLYNDTWNGSVGGSISGGVVRANRTGRSILVDVNQIAGTSLNGYLRFNLALDSVYFPPAYRSQPVYSTINGSGTSGVCFITTTGSMEIYSDVQLSNFTGTIAIGGFGMSYNV